MPGALLTTSMSPSAQTTSSVMSSGSGTAGTGGGISTSISSVSETFWPALPATAPFTVT